MVLSNLVIIFLALYILYRLYKYLDDSGSRDVKNEAQKLINEYDKKIAKKELLSKIDLKEYEEAKKIVETIEGKIK